MLLKKTQVNLIAFLFSSIHILLQYLLIYKPLLLLTLMLMVNHQALYISMLWFARYPLRRSTLHHWVFYVHWCSQEKTVLRGRYVFSLVAHMAIVVYQAFL